MIYYQGDILEQIQTGCIYVVGRSVENGLELLPGNLHPKLGFFMQDQNSVPVKVSWSPTDFRKIGVAPSFFAGAMVLKWR